VEILTASHLNTFSGGDPDSFSGGDPGRVKVRPPNRRRAPQNICIGVALLLLKKYSPLSLYPKSPLYRLTFCFRIEEVNCYCKNKRFFYVYFVFGVQLHENKYIVFVK
jgi:hypothetical protein